MICNKVILFSLVNCRRSHREAIGLMNAIERNRFTSAFLYVQTCFLCCTLKNTMRRHRREDRGRYGFAGVLKNPLVSFLFKVNPTFLPFHSGDVVSSSLVKISFHRLKAFSTSNKDKSTDVWIAAVTSDDSI